MKYPLMNIENEQRDKVKGIFLYHSFISKEIKSQYKDVTSSVQTKIILGGNGKLFDKDDLNERCHCQSKVARWMFKAL